MSKSRSMPDFDDFEGLFVNNSDLDTIRSHLGRFNPIKTMGMERMEIRHSAILGWLLSPQETHGLGDTFLKAFLAQALRGHDCNLSPSALEVSQADMMDAEVRREWRNIDLLVLSSLNGWVFIIENKFDSSQHSNQLERYMEVISTSLMDGKTYKHRRGIFLSLWEEEPKDQRYAPIEYSTICELLGQIALSGRIPLAPEVEHFLRYYLDVIKEATDMSDEQEEMKNLARQLYRDHRRALDFILEHGKSTEFITACEAVFGKNLKHGCLIEIDEQSLVFNQSETNRFSFLPKSWYEAFDGDQFYWQGCENWWAGLPTIMWLQLTSNSDGASGQIRIFAEVGPLDDHSFRSKLIGEIKDIANKKNLDRIKFQRGASDEGKKYSRFLKKNSFFVEDVHDHDQITNAIKNALSSFNNEIEAIGSILPKFLDYGSKK